MRGCSNSLLRIRSEAAMSAQPLVQEAAETPTSLLEKEAIPFHTSPLRDGDAMFH